jgi:signal transduction histidine kinase
VSQHAEQRLARVPQSIREGREALRQWCSTWGVTDVTVDGSEPGLLDDALLVLTELLTNALRFSDGDIEIVVDARRDHLQIAVRDDNAAMAKVRAADTADTAGRGIAMVEALSQSWGQYPRGEGKVVWARLTVPSGSGIGQPGPQRS